MPILSSRLRTLAAALALAAALGACESWSRQPVASPEPERLVSIRGPVRVTRAGGPPAVLVGVRVGRDGLFGSEHAKPNGRVAIPVSDVRKVETQQVSPLAIAAVVVLAIGTFIAVTGAFIPHTQCSCLPPP
ncbi:MAG TPA: hypothetical protein VM890_00650 [Longimicrobium sp.]|nr:hypothetical protein [Longimicrobium sp.]